MSKACKKCKKLRLVLGSYIEAVENLGGDAAFLTKDFFEPSAHPDDPELKEALKKI